MATPLYVNAPDLDSIGAIVQEAVDAIGQAFDRVGGDLQSSSAMTPHVLDRALNHFLDVLGCANNDQLGVPGAVPYKDPFADNDQPGLSREELSAVANRGLQLLDDLSEWARTLALPDQESRVNTVMVMIALWVARHGGELHAIESVVNTLAEIANATTEQQELAELSDMMGELAYAISQQTKFDFENKERHRPWRVLNLNRGITATRSHDTHIMETAFDDLIRNIPEEAETFFRQGMQQMEQLDYPDHVRDFVSRYYRQSKSRVLH